MKSDRILKTLGVAFAPLGVNSIVSEATDPGSMAAINSASADYRNIIGAEISTATNEQRAAVFEGINW